MGDKVLPPHGVWRIDATKIDVTAAPRRHHNMAFSVVAKSGWRKVSLPPEFFQKGGAEGLMCIDELTDYELVKGVYLADNKAKVIANLFVTLIISPIPLARCRWLMMCCYLLYL